MATKHQKLYTKEDLIKEREEKIRQYEEFIDKRLKADLRTILEARDKIYEQIAKYIDTKSKLELIKEQNLHQMKSMVNLGNEFYAQAMIPDTTYVYLNVGLGFHVQFTHEEAFDFIKIKEEDLTKQAQKLTTQAAEIKTRIKLLYNGIADLMNLASLE